MTSSSLRHNYLTLDNLFFLGALFNKIAGRLMKVVVDLANNVLLLRVNSTKVAVHRYSLKQVFYELCNIHRKTLLVKSNNDLSNIPHKEHSKQTE